MTIPTETLNEWKTLKERGDVPKLVKITGLSRSGLYVILDGGVCTYSVGAKLIKFFEAKKKDRELVDKHIQDQD